MAASTPSLSGVVHLMQTAREIHAQRPSWVTFFREILGISGLVREAFPNPDDRRAFELTDDYAELQSMLSKLRKRDADLPGGLREPTRVVTVRMPKSLHESLREEAHGRRQSMNQLCIAKLVVPAAAANGGVNGNSDGNGNGEAEY